MFQHPNSFRIGDTSYKRVQLLGQGAFGSVFKVKDQRGNFYALKDIPALSKDCNEATHAEISMLMDVEHENIVKLYGCDCYEWEDILHVCLLLDYCSGGTLNDALEGKHSEFMNYIWMTQLSEAIDFLHLKDIIHRDLKPENVLLDEYNCIKLADFGLARLVSFMKNTDKNGISWIATYIECYQQTCVGTPQWMAPEVYDHHYTKKADIFSLGVLFYAISERSYIISGNKRYYGAFVPYGDSMVGIGNVYAEKGPMVSIEFSLTGATRGVRELIKDMLEFKPRDRPDSREVKERIITMSKSFSRLSLLDNSDPVNNTDQGFSSMCCS